MIAEIEILQALWKLEISRIKLFVTQIYLYFKKIKVGILDWKLKRKERRLQYLQGE
jgi:hypothetical protein